MPSPEAEIAQTYTPPIDKASCGQVLAVPAPKTPPLTPTPDTIMRDAMTTDVDIMVTVPAMVEVSCLYSPQFSLLIVGST